MDEMLQYLAELEANNERTWYHAHAEERKEATAAFLALVQELILKSENLTSGCFFTTRKT